MTNTLKSFPESFPKNPSFWEGFDSKQPSLPDFGESFPILPKAFGKDFNRCKSRNNNTKHTLSPPEFKSFPTRSPRAVFLVCVLSGRIPCEGFDQTTFSLQCQYNPKSLLRTPRCNNESDVCRMSVLLARNGSAFSKRMPAEST